MKVAGLAFLVSLVTAASVGASSLAKVVASSSSSGDYAVTVASGTAKHPKKLSVRVKASPAQKATVAWSTICSRGFSASSKSGQFTARAPLTRTIKISLPHADSCIVSADAQLSQSGRLVVQILSG